MSFSPKMTSSEIAKIRLAIAIRATIKTSKKVLFYVCKTLKNGAFWVAYKIDGVKCSTFVSRAKFEGFLKEAAASEESTNTYTQYVTELVNQYSNITLTSVGKIVSITKVIPNRIKDIKMDYQFIYDDNDGVFRLSVDSALHAMPSQLGMRFAQQFTTVKELISHIAGK